jgi:ribulose kinase
MRLPKVLLSAVAGLALVAAVQPASYAQAKSSQQESQCCPERYAADSPEQSEIRSMRWRRYIQF